MRFINLASSSDGNCTFISDGKYNILIDCGITHKRIKNKLEELNVSIDNIDAIFVTHGHIDHIRGLEVFMKEHIKTKIYGYFDTFLYIDKCYPSKYDYNRFLNIDVDKEYDMKDYIAPDCKIKISAFHCPHDAPCVYYKININNQILGILTDCGYYDKKILNNLLDVNYLMLESNYDEDLIDRSIYSQYLINRIKGKGGHLSNKNALQIIYEIINDNLNTICLSHISKNTNTEENAYNYVKYNMENNLENIKLPKLLVASRVNNTIIIDN